MPETNYAASASGTLFKVGANTVLNVSKISGIELTADSQESSLLNNTFKEYIGGKPDGGEITVEGFLYTGDTNGQVAIKNALAAGTVLACTVEFPAAINASWTFNAVVTSWATGDVEQEGPLTMTMGLKITGEPTVNISASTGLTTGFFAISESAEIIPAPSGSVYNYVATVLTGVTSVTVTPTASAGVITVNGNTVASGAASSAIALGAAGSVTPITIVVKETGKIAKTYTINLARA